MSEDIQPLADLLYQSVLSPDQARAAEQQLKSSEDKPRFSIMLLHVVANDQFQLQTRLAGALFFKNFIKRKWTDEDGNYKIPEQDVNDLKNEIISLMIQLPRNLQVQIGEAVSIMADSDFPHRWENLVPTLVQQLGQNTKTDNGVLVVAHSIFKRWRPLFRSDDLFSEIKLVLQQFAEPFLKLFEKTHAEIAQTNDNGHLRELFESMLLLTKIYFDLNCQDLPEFFEDNLTKFMDIFRQYLQYSNPALDDGDEEHSGVLENLKSSICEVLELYTMRYEEEFTPVLPGFVEVVWHLLRELGPEAKYDLLVSKSLAFLTAVARIHRQVQIFDGPLEQVIEGIVLPNMALRQSDEELYEDDPIEFIRRDLEGSDSDTRRRAATDFIRELASKLEARVVNTVQRYVEGFMNKYNQDPANNWRDKDTAMYLYSALNSKSAAPNALMDVVQFFTQNVAPDLVNQNVPPMLKVDAIKFIYTFRNQLTKEQLAETLRLLMQHLQSSEFVVYTYTAITIERILAVRSGGVNGTLLFTRQDIEPFARDLLTHLFKLATVNMQTPEKLAENEFLMKCIMRVMVTVQDGIASDAEVMLRQLVAIVGEISKNPSNPRYTHYVFESIGSIIRFCAGSLGTAKVEEIVMPPFMNILQQDVQEFMPYVFQLLSQLLRASNPPLSDNYQKLIQPLMAPVLWESRGNIQSLVGLLQAILAQGGSNVIVTQGQVEPLLGVFQKLVSSKTNDGYALDLLEQIFIGIPVDQLQQYIHTIGTLLLQRLQSSRTERFVTRLSRFVFFISCESQSLGPMFAIKLFDSIQDTIFGQILTNFVLPSTLKIQGPVNRKIAAVGLLRLLCTQEMLQGKYSQQFGTGLNRLVELVNAEVPEAEQDDLASALETEDVSFGASFSKLATTNTKQIDPVANIPNGHQYCVQQLKQLNADHGGALQKMNDLSPDTVEFLTKNGI